VCPRAILLRFPLPLPSLLLSAQVGGHCVGWSALRWRCAWEPWEPWGRWWWWRWRWRWRWRSWWWTRSSSVWCTTTCTTRARRPTPGAAGCRRSTPPCSRRTIAAAWPSSPTSLCAATTIPPPSGMPLLSPSDAPPLLHYLLLERALGRKILLCLHEFPADFPFLSFLATSPISLWPQQLTSRFPGLPLISEHELVPVQIL
jgi:hypothetical protein